MQVHTAVRGMVHEAVALEIPGEVQEDVEDYVTRLLVQFVKTEEVFLIRDPLGRPLTSVYEMLGEADVLLNADSFERERQVHKHIGELLAGGVHGIVFLTLEHHQAPVGQGVQQPANCLLELRRCGLTAGEQQRRNLQCARPLRLETIRSKSTILAN